MYGDGTGASTGVCTDTRDGAMSQITVISGPERRRVWNDAQKRALVAAASAPGANVADIARRADLRPNQIYRWRRQMEQAAQGFAEVRVQPEAAEPSAPSAVIVVEFERAIVRIPQGARPSMVSAILRSIKP